MPELVSLARTVRRTPPRAADNRMPCTVTLPDVVEVAVPVVPDITGAVVSRMMSSVFVLLCVPKRCTNRAYTVFGSRSSRLATSVHGTSA